MKKVLFSPFVFLISFSVMAQEWHHPFGWRDSKEFGIVNDSSADVTAGMRLMMASFPTAGGTAIFPIGRFLVSDSVLIPSNVNIFGSGATTYVPTFASTGTAFYFNSATKNFLVTKPGSPPLFTIGNIFQNFTIYNVSAGASAGTAILMYHTNSSIIRNLEIVNFWDNITIRGGNGYFIQDCGLYGFIHTGITVGNNVNADEGDYVLSGLTIVGNTTSATQPYAGIMWLGSGGMKLSASKFNGGGGKTHEMKYCVSMLGTDGATSDIDISQVSMENYDSTAIYGNFQSILRHIIIGNVQMDGVGPFGPAISLSWAGSFNAINGQVSISNYVITDFTTTNSQAAILINNCSNVNIGTGIISRYAAPSVTASTNVNIDYSISSEILPASGTIGLLTAPIAGTAISVLAGNTTNSAMNLAAGTIKTSPAQGDLMAVSGHLWYRDGSTTYDLITPSLGSNFSFVNATPTLTVGGGTPSQTFNATSSSGNAGYYARSTNTGGLSLFYLENNRGSFASYGGCIYGGTATGSSIFGQTEADKLFLFADGANNLGFAMGTLQSQPLILGTNNTERLRISGTGIYTIPSLSFATGAKSDSVITESTAAGIMTISKVAQNSIGSTMPYRGITALRTLDATDYYVDCTANSFTVTLPTAVGIAGRAYVVKNSGSSTTITMATTLGQTIDGSAPGTITTLVPLKVFSDGANWKTW